MSFKAVFNIQSQHNHRIFGLDFLRALAISLVVFSHGFSFVSSKYPLLSYLFFMDGVDLFFVLSGFLIGGILLRIFLKHEHFTIKLLLGFWKRRWLRTLPNYYFILGLNLLFPLLINPLLGQPSVLPFEVWGKFWVFSQNLFSAHPAFFPEAWSLAVEEWFYLISPVLLLINYLIFNKLISKKFIFISSYLLLLLVLSYHRYTVGNSQEMSLSDWDIQFRKIVIFRLDAILYGVLAAYIKHEFISFWRRIAWPAFVLGALGLGVLQWFFHTTLNFDVVHPLLRLWYFPLTSLAVMLVLPLADAWTSAKGQFAKFITRLSLISYSMYLVNFYLILQKLQRLRVHFPQNLTWSLVFLATYLFLVFVVSTLLYQFLEKPIMDRRRSEN